MGSGRRWPHWKVETRLLLPKGAEMLSSRVRFVLIAAAIGIAALCLFRAIAVNDRRNELAEADQRVAAEMVNEVVGMLRDMPGDDPLCRRYGKFQRLNLREWNRTPRIFDLPPALSCQGMAEFEKAHCRIIVTVTRGPRDFGIQLTPDEGWLAKHPDAKLELEGNEFVLRHEGKMCSEIHVAATRPGFQEQ
ncbi:MAG: hypothetical protein KF774_05030 [Planctomyces sp.]|nr:hypothetical protein [Planctomyces sp.]